MKFKLAVILLLLYHQPGDAQIISGRVVERINGVDLPLPGANIFWTDHSAAVTTGDDGVFNISLNINTQPYLVSSFIGYQNDTIYINDKSIQVIFRLKNVIELNAVDIKGKRDATVVSTIQPRNTELITQKELLKAACCNLSESFETNPSVDVNYTDAVTGAKEIQMLGLSGIYTQMLTEAIPSMHGAGSVFGLNYIPGPWMESIQISKGAGSVANGHEAITGQINIEYLKPESMEERMFINLFGDMEGRVELNTVNKFNISDKLSYMLLLHGSMNNTRIDVNDDGFLDMPLAKQINIYNRFRYHSGKKLEGQAGVKFIAEDRLGGQKSFNPVTDRGYSNVYGAGIETRRLEVYTKTGIVYPETPYKSMGLQLLGIYHNQNSYFGLRDYDIEQKSFYANYAYITMIHSQVHKIKLGSDIKIDNYNELFINEKFTRTETTPGLYAEYTFDNAKRWGIIAGGRVDHNNEFGWYFSPRANVKYNFSPQTIIRVSGGKGFRIPNIFTDNIGVMSSGKQIVILEKPLPEVAWNGGLNATTKFALFNQEASFSGDYYYTFFENQFLVDQYSVNNAILYYNLSGNSIAQSLQGTFTYELLPGLDLKLAYKWDDVHTDYIYARNIARPLFAKEKALANVAYETRNKKWRFDATAQWNGIKPLPSLAANQTFEPGVIYYSPEYTVYNSQITRVFKIWEIYIGAENIGDFTQEQPIINPTQPFSTVFDASAIWGPVTGRKIYGGIRLKIF